MSNLKIFFLSAFLCTAYGDTSSECGIPQVAATSETRSARGDTASNGEYPWMVRLGMTDNNTNEKVFHCGGTLVSDNVVLSSAKCTRAASIVRIGDYNIDTEEDCDECGVCSPPPQDVRIKRSKTSEACAKTRTNDIAVILLEQSVKFDVFVQPICLRSNSQTRSPTEGVLFSISGWSSVNLTVISVRNGTGTASREMKYAVSPIVKPDECNAVYVRELEESQLCLGFPKEAKDPCIGEPGGALIGTIEENGVKRSYLAGITNHDKKMCEIGENAPSVYTDVSQFSDWIEETINDFKKS